MIRHIAMMRFADGTTDEQIQAISDGVATLPGLIPEIVAYEAGSDLGLSDSNYDFAVVGDFASESDYEIYSIHADHVAVIDMFFRPIVDTVQRVQLAF